MRLWSGFDDRAVLDFDRVEEGHAGAESGADGLDLVGGFGFADAGELVAAGLVFCDEFLGEGAVLDLVEEGLHGASDFRGDDARTGYVVAPLGGVGDGVAHVFEAAAVHEIDDQFELVEALEVGELGLVAGFYEDFEARFDEGGSSPAEHRLLAEEVGFGFFSEGGFEDAGAGAADGFGVRQGLGEGMAGAVLLDGYKGRDATAFGEHLADAVAGGLGGAHGDVDAGGGVMVRKRMLKPWANMRVTSGRMLGAMSAW